MTWQGWVWLALADVVLVIAAGKLLKAARLRDAGCPWCGDHDPDPGDRDDCVRCGLSLSELPR